VTGPKPKRPTLSHKHKKKEKKKEKTEEHKEKLITRVKLWSGDAEDVVKRARNAVCHLKSWQPKHFRFHCPVPGCQTRLPSQEILDLHINGVKNGKHKVYRRQRGTTNHRYQGTTNLLAPLHQWTLIIDTCCLINDNGAEANKLITHAGVERMAAEERIDMVIPYKVWAELEHQSKSGDGDIAFGARVVVRMLRGALEANIAEGNIQRHVLRSQTIVEAREAAAQFLPHDFPRSTNDDHILACALLENERAHRKSATPRQVEVILITQDNNLACKAYSNGLQVQSFSEFREMYRCRSSTQIHEASTSAVPPRDNTATAPHNEVEVIELLSDSSDEEVEIIDLTNT